MAWTICPTCGAKGEPNGGGTYATCPKGCPGTPVRVEKLRTYHVLIRVRATATRTIEGVERLVYVPLWWTISDNKPHEHAVGHGQYTIMLCDLEAEDVAAARAIFLTSYPFYGAMLVGVASTHDEDWAGKIVDENEHDEMMAGFYMSRMAARRDGKPLPEHPRLSRDLSGLVGEHVRLGLSVEGRIVSASKLDQWPHNRWGFQPAALLSEPSSELSPRPIIPVEEREILGVIKLSRTARVGNED